MPGVIGAIDSTHIATQSPGSDDAEIYRNQKGFFSINVQLVCEPTGYISDVVARGKLPAMLETQQINGCLVGGGGYACVCGTC